MNIKYSEVADCTVPMMLEIIVRQKMKYGDFTVLARD